MKKMCGTTVDRREPIRESQRPICELNLLDIGAETARWRSMVAER